MTTPKPEYITRWAGDSGRAQARAVVEVLCKHQRLDTLPFIEQHNGKWDLRGITFGHLTTKKSLLHGYQVTQVAGQVAFERVALRGVDLSFADLRSSTWTHCVLEDVLLVHA